MASGNIRLIGITGMGGLGKSTLAAKVYQDDSAEFSNKFWADVSRVGFTELARRVLLRLGLSQVVVDGIPEISLVDALINHLRKGKYLLIIDNLESWLTEDGQWLNQIYQEFFLGWIGCGGESVVLVTTRERPTLPEIKSQWLPLSGLSPVEGAALLRDLGIRGGDGELEEFAKNAEGHPLLLTLVAGFLRVEEEVNPQISYLQHYPLADVSNLLIDKNLTGLHHGKVDIWMLRILEASFSRIGERLRELLLGLCVYRLPFNAVMAGFINSSTSPLQIEIESDNIKIKTIEKDLRQLAKRSLLQEERDKDRVRWFQFQPFIQEYAKHKAGDLTAAHQRAINYYLSKLKSPPWQTEEDIKEYLEVFYHYCQLKEYIPAFDILRRCDYFLTLRGDSNIRVELYGQLVQEWNLSKLEWQFAASLTDLGNAYYSLGQYQLAIEYYQQSKEIFEEIGDRSGIAKSLMGLGNAYYSLGQYQLAIEYYQQSKEIKEEIGERSGIANSLNNLGSAYDSLGQYQLAIEY
ncbi:tetratricopeptide repeat protein, partial [Symplocastrum sp. BBK-W-15]|nr:tetratricopeptide repeat protein [Limnofasciculus baicalensis BBK-W-15]